VCRLLRSTELNIRNSLQELYFTNHIEHISQFFDKFFFRRRSNNTRRLLFYFLHELFCELCI
jgi:hypothetical protein